MEAGGMPRNNIIAALGPDAAPQRGCLAQLAIQLFDPGSLPGCEARKLLREWLAKSERFALGRRRCPELLSTFEFAPAVGFAEIGIGVSVGDRRGAAH